MSAPRTKRQFAGAASDPAQRRITSFFNSGPGAAPSSAANEPSSVSRNGLGAVDSSVQANLLSVGMRVRKAIPEGYKTGGYCAFSLWDENNNAKTKTVSAPTKPAYDAPRSSRGAAAAATTPRELLPFCGIHKIGGMDTQKSAADDFAFSLPATGGDGPLGLLDMDEEAVPGLTLSQESVESNDSVDSSRTRKRFFAADDDEDDEEEEAVEHLQDLGNGRRMATPRKARFRGKFGETVGQENVMVVDDFEEASFLDPSLEVDMNDI
ncbi:hypothetical protein KJ359_009366 [Pestalotiopsis sp. 9143b]|nr:hypothetical protein KJ359_009366 [Pestalotiopsis sp. 9143b]